MNATPTRTRDDVVYPESDGKPMADNTLQWDWMVKIVGELRLLFRHQNVFVAGDLFWYPVQGEPRTVTAPDALVVFGRPPGYRGSYKQWEEDGIPPQVVFEILSPNNTPDEMDDKLHWYDRHGVEEYYLIDPDKNQLSGWIRRDGRLCSVYPMAGFVSPRLHIRFDVNSEVLLYTPDGRPFQTREEQFEDIAEELRKTALAFEDERARATAAERLAQEHATRAGEERERAIAAERQAQQEAKHAEQERTRAEHERVRAEQERLAKEALATKLRELGINPDDLLRSTQ